MFFSSKMLKIEKISIYNINNFAKNDNVIKFLNVYRNDSNVLFFMINLILNSIYVLIFLKLFFIEWIYKTK